MITSAQLEPHPTPAHLRRRRQHRRFASLCEASGFHYVTVLDWGACASDPARLPGEGDGEHQHAIVWAPDRKGFVEALFEWADRHDIDRRSLKWKTLTGWEGFSDTAMTKLLQTHIARMTSYATKPPADGRTTRDLRKDALAAGIFANAWQHFVCNATVGAPRSVTRWCPACGEPAPTTATTRWKFCGGSCRVRAHRDPSKLRPFKWIVAPASRAIGGSSGEAQQPRGQLNHLLRMTRLVSSRKLPLPPLLTA